MTSYHPPTPPVPDTGRPTLICLHWLGGSARSWDRVAAQLAPFIDIVPLDLPGFGDDADSRPADVAGMAEVVMATVRRLAPRRWMIAGHSMGAKVALAVARAAEDGGEGLAGLSHLILLAGSPPRPEPMDEKRRQTMLGWFEGDAADSRRQAQDFIDANIAAPLPDAVHADVMADILRLARPAWVAWLERGSREDWADRVGALATPALVVAGGRDGDLGEDGQRTHMLPHLSRATFAVVPDAAHLLPLERPREITELILRHAGLPGLAAAGPAFRRIVASDRVSARTRAVLVARAAADDMATPPRVIAPDQMPALRALAAAVLPQDAGFVIDIAARIDRELAGTGDGWRFADLPPDADAYRQALETLRREADRRHGQDFADLTDLHRDMLLRRIAAGEIEADGPLSPEQMQRWFQDVRAAIVRIYMAHPATMARIGYDGFAYGGDGARLQGFVAVEAGQAEPWQLNSRQDGQS